MPPPSTVWRTCTVCEASCGLGFAVADNKVVGAIPDPDDVFSRGFACRKGIELPRVADDPDRLTTPLVRGPSGDFHAAGWDEALDLIAARCKDIRRRHGRDSLALYIGNPLVHQAGMLLLRNAFVKALGTRNAYSAGSQDTSPRFAVSRWLYGSSLAVPVPDLERTSCFVCMGANPAISNGSLLTAPDMRRRCKAIQARGGKIIVVDPRRSETAQIADQHIAIKPGGDAALLLAVAATLARDHTVPQAFLAGHTTGWPAVARRLAAFDIGAAATQAGVTVDTVTNLARDIATAPAAAVYSRTGVGNARFGTLAIYAADLVNILSGNLGVAGGSMFAAPALDATLVTRLPGQDGIARWHSRVRGLPETFGDLPAACLAEEMEVPGPGQVKALLTIAGNPVLSTPNGRRLEAAIKGLDFVASVDFYLNETTRHAHVILPPAPPLSDEHIDLLYPMVYVRNVVRWSPPVIAPGPHDRQDWQIMLALIDRLGGGPTGIKPIDWLWRIARRCGYRWQPSHMINALLRLGPRGDHFLPWRRGLDLPQLRAAPHGIDLGPLPEGHRHRMFHRDRRVHLAAPALMQAWDELTATLVTPRPPDELLLVGRRQMLSKNTWLHNLPTLRLGEDKCRLLIHPHDAHRLGLAPDGRALLSSDVHQAEVAIQLSEDMRPGVVSLPHGWGHGGPGAKLGHATSRPGVSANDWTNDQDVDRCIGQSILNGVPVRLQPLGGATGVAPLAPQTR